MQVPPFGSSPASTGQPGRDASAGVRVVGSEPAPALKICSVSKCFGAVQANDQVDCTVAAGTIHALVGENGAGKTTLMRIVYGLYAPDSGYLEMNGEAVEFSSPRDALSRGVGMVHQHSLLVNSLTVAENVLLATPGLGRPPRRQVLARLRALSSTNHLHLDPNLQVGKLSVGQRQRAEILSALFHGARLLILDEPTTVLTPQEVEELFSVMRRLRTGGATILLVTHKLAEVIAVADRVTVMRGGKIVTTVDTGATDDRALVRMMVGRDVPARVSDEAPARTATGSDILGEAKDLRVLDEGGIERVRNVSFQIYPGEIVAITGVEGNGQIELTEALVGLRRLAGGELWLSGRNVTRASVARRRRAGLAYIPESRLTEGISASVSVRDNLILGRHGESAFARFGLRNLPATAAYARRLVDEFKVVTPSVDSEAAILSGGNLQKVVVAREVTRAPRLLIAAQPTQGVDVAAAHLIRSTLLHLRDRGMAIVLVSSDLSEVCDLADRALVLYNGSVFGELSRQELTEEAIGVFAMGLRAGDGAA